MLFDAGRLKRKYCWDYKKVSLRFNN